MRYALLKIFILSTILFNISFPIYAQGFQWAKSAGGTNNDLGLSVVVDVSGNIYMTGHFDSPTITFGTTTLTTAGNSDLYLVKYDANGNVLWAKSAGGSGNDVGVSVAVDLYGNVYITGNFESPSITFGTTTFTNTGISDMYIAKYDPDGNVLWAKSSGGTGNDWGFSLMLDPSGNMYMIGCFQSPSITIGTTTLSNNGISDIFLTKYDSNGNVLWAKSAGGTGFEYGQGITVDASGNVFITGYFQSSTITFGTTTLTNAGANDIFLAKYDLNGNVLWAKSAEGNDFEYGQSVAVDASGNAYITGDFTSSSITFGTTTLTNAGSNDIYIAKYDVDGNLLWAKSVGGSGYDSGHFVVADASNCVSVIGWFNSASITFGTTTLTNAGASDIFLTRYDSNGNVLWAKSAGESGYDYGFSVAADGNGNAYMTGHFKSPSITFGTTTLTNTSSNKSDIFLTKYNPLLNGVSETESALPGDFSLSQNYPNPFNPNTKIDYILPSSANVKLNVFSVTGELVKNLVNEQKDAGSYSVDFNANTLPSGIYFYTLQTNNSTLTRKMIYLK